MSQRRVGDQQRQRACCRAKIVVSQYSRNAIELGGAAGVDGVDARVGMRATQDSCMQHIGQFDIINVYAMAGEETLVFSARNRCSKYLRCHARSPPALP